jgi:hypothetical protein
MPRNPNRRACAVPGCHAWARHEGDLCASHAGSRALKNHGHLALPLLKAVSQPAPATDDLTVIEAELRRLEDARARFLEWIEEVRAETEGDCRPTVNPVQFLRAWGDSSARVVALLRARRDLTGTGDDGAGALDALYEAIERRLTNGHAEAADGQ